MVLSENKEWPGDRVGMAESQGAGSIRMMASSAEEGGPAL